MTLLSYQAYGKRRNGGSWDGSPPGNELIDIRAVTTRGYTGHQMLDDSGFIHMGGRVYDPTLGKFLSPDPNIPNPGNSQAFNRYAYVYNNPLSYTDPSGFVPKRDEPKVEEPEELSNRAKFEEEKCRRAGYECIIKKDGQGLERAYRVIRSEVSKNTGDYSLLRDGPSFVDYGNSYSPDGVRASGTENDWFSPELGLFANLGTIGLGTAIAGTMDLFPTNLPTNTVDYGLNRTNAMRNAFGAQKLAALGKVATRASVIGIAVGVLDNGTQVVNALAMDDTEGAALAATDFAVDTTVMAIGGYAMASGPWGWAAGAVIVGGYLLYDYGNGGNAAQHLWNTYGRREEERSGGW